MPSRNVVIFGFVSPWRDCLNHYMDLSIFVSDLLMYRFYVHETTFIFCDFVFFFSIHFQNNLQFTRIFQWRLMELLLIRENHQIQKRIQWNLYSMLDSCFVLFFNSHFRFFIILNVRQINHRHDHWDKYVECSHFFFVNSLLFHETDHHDFFFSLSLSLTLSFIFFFFTTTFASLC